MKRKVAIFGGGPSALILSCMLDSAIFDVTVYEKNKACGRKFLVAGKGGFNLTFWEPMQAFKEKYLPKSFMDRALHHFSNEDLRSWLSDLGVETFVGTSRRVFPLKGTKPIQVLEAILQKAVSKGVKIECNKEWKGWSNEGHPLVGEEEVVSDYNVFCMGGATWPKTGSIGDWSKYMLDKGISILPFEPSNCAFSVDWPKHLLDEVEGSPLKNISISCENKEKKGEVVITQFGLEGNAIYALSDNIRRAVKEEGRATIMIDLKPIFSVEDILQKKTNSRSKNISEFLKRDLKLDRTARILLKACTTKQEFVDMELLAKKIKSLEIEITGMGRLEEAISSVGGVDTVELTEEYELKKMPNSFCIGEMVDWDAPTGGYLLQGCFSMGALLAFALNQRHT